MINCREGSLAILNNLWLIPRKRNREAIAILDLLELMAWITIISTEIDRGRRSIIPHYGDSIILFPSQTLNDSRSDEYRAVPLWSAFLYWLIIVRQSHLNNV
jgi:hypothetical protein